MVGYLMKKVKKVEEPGSAQGDYLGIFGNMARVKARNTLISDMIFHENMGRLPSFPAIMSGKGRCQSR